MKGSQISIRRDTSQLEWKWCLIFLFWTTKTLVWRVSQGSYLVRIVHWEHRMHCLYTITSRLLIFVYLILKILQFSKTTIVIFTVTVSLSDTCDLWKVLLRLRLKSCWSKERKVPKMGPIMNSSSLSYIIIRKNNLKLSAKTFCQEAPP